MCLLALFLIRVCVCVHCFVGGARDLGQRKKLRKSAATPSLHRDASGAPYKWHIVQDQDDGGLIDRGRPSSAGGAAAAVNGAGASIPI